MKIKKTKTQRGFAAGEFTDTHDNSCSIQKSSVGTYNAIWLGINDPAPKIMAIHAPKLGVKTNETTGWVPYPVPEEVSFVTRMHLSQAQVKKLLPILEKFVKTGEI